jgi:cysteinyl-tRNA synthetase
MTIRIHNTVSQRKEVLEPLVPGEIRMYACGPTVYDRAHIGHARAALTFDVIWRYLEYRGYKVIYVRNYTDVDDKIIHRAASLGQSWDSLAEEQIEAYRQDMRALGLRTPTEEPRATRHIQEMIGMIQSLIMKRVAYPVDGDVYFEVRRFPDYGKLSHRDLEELRVGARIEVDPRKRDPLDFALWKASKPGEPSWDSPWGAGRPGWHIECSAMSMKYLGETFDIHGGGGDLIFPHHENEIAQSECATGKPFARYWVHNGFVNIQAEKMSKSLGNVLTVRDLLSHHTPDALKIFLLGTHYRAPLDFSEEAITGAGRAEERFLKALEKAEIDRLQQVGSPDHDPSGVDCLFVRKIREAEQEFVEAMDDDFNTPRALAVLFNLTRDINVAMKDAERESDKALFSALCLAGGALRRLGWVLGGLLEARVVRRKVTDYVAAKDTVKVEVSDYIAAREAVDRASKAGQPLPEDKISLIVEYRSQRRDEQDWAAADADRAWLADRGVIVDDTARGARWWRKTSSP